VVAFFQGGHGPFPEVAYPGAAYLVASFPSLEGLHLVDAYQGEDLSWAYLEEDLQACLP